MPFTLSHPAATLPLAKLSRNRLPALALIAGSVSPDLGYYFTPTLWFQENAHTLPRSFTFCLPAGLTLVFLIQLLGPRLCPPLLPRGLAALLEKACTPRFFSLRALPYTLLAVLLGAWSHLLWDSFTHKHGFFVNLWPALQIETVYGFEAFRLLQHFSTLAGGAVLYLWAAQGARRLGLPLQWKISWKWACWVLAFAIAFAFTYSTFQHDLNYALTNNDRRPGFLFLISLVRNFSVAVVLAGVALRLVQRLRRNA